MFKPVSKLSQMVSLVLLIFLVAVITMMIYIWQTHPAPRPIAVPGSLLWLADIDVDQNQLIDRASILAGRDAIVVVDPHGAVSKTLAMHHSRYSGEVKVPHIDLLSLDLNNDGLISSLDPIYQYIQLMYFTHKGDKFHIVPISTTIIQGIRLKHINAHNQHTAVLRDNTQVLVRPK